MEPDFSTQHYRSYFFPSLRRELSLPCPLHLSGLRVTHRSPGCFFVYAFNFAPGHSRLIMVPHWDKQATLSKGSNAEDWEQSMHFSYWIFVLLSLLRPSVEIVESGSCFCSEVRQSLITQGMSLSCKWMWPCVSLCLLVQEAAIGCSRSWPSECPCHSRCSLCDSCSSAVAVPLRMQGFLGPKRCETIEMHDPLHLNTVVQADIIWGN